MGGAKGVELINGEFVSSLNMSGFHKCLSLDVHIFWDIIVLCRDEDGEVICVWNMVSVGCEE